MNLEELKQSWKSDTKINELDLSRESLKTPHLHSKYLDLLIDAKRRTSKTRHDLARMQQFKGRYYRGELSKDELKEYGLPQYQFNAPLKSQMESVLDADEDCIKIKENIEELETMVYMLEAIMKSIYSRSFDIKNSIEFTKFQAGN